MERTKYLVGPLFPSTESFLIFCMYISLFVSQGLLVTAVQQSQLPGFNAIVVVLLVEITKLCVSILIYLIRSQGGRIKALLYDIRRNKKLLVLYLVPAFLYSLYNNLTFINLKLFDLSTYYCLMQFRIVLTALIYQILFRRQLTLSQWTSLLILTSGCLVKEYGMYNHISTGTHQQSAINTVGSKGQNPIVAEHESEVTASNQFIKFLWSLSLLLLQMFCSCFAGVYNEYLLKDSSTSQGAGIILQNIFMYLDSILCSLLALIISSSYLENNLLFSDIGYREILVNLLTSPLVVLLILNNAASGLIASLFLKSLNSILKTFAAALELFAVAFFAWLLFDNHLDRYTLIALILVTLATTLYSRYPVSVAPPTKAPQDIDRGEFVRLPIDEE